jgi:hypothetical protein
MEVIPETYLMKVIPETYMMNVFPETYLMKVNIKLFESNKAKRPKQDSQIRQSSPMPEGENNPFLLFVNINNELIKISSGIGELCRVWLSCLGLLALLLSNSFIFFWLPNLLILSVPDDSDGHQLHQYQQNKQLLLILAEFTEHTKKTTTYDVGNPDPGFGQAQKCGREKPVNGMSTMLS